MPRYDHLQILRAVAALLVVFGHAVFTLSGEGYSLDRYVPSASVAGLISVQAFFLLSGLIMSIHSYQYFGQPAMAKVFVWRRLIRIVPMYWLATLAMLAEDLVMRMRDAHLTTVTLLSLGFLPNYFSEDVVKLAPLLPQGWTLNYEMAFYLVFALALLFQRRIGLTLLIIVPELLVFLSKVISLPAAHSPGAMIGYYLSDNILLFSHGVLLGVLLCETKRVPALRLPFSPALLLLVPSLISLVWGNGLTGIMWQFIPTFEIAVVVLCVMPPPTTPGVVNRALILLGDASYSTYLFHSFVLSALSLLRHAVFGRTHVLDGWLTGYVILATVLGTLFGLVVHLVIERPVTRALRNIRFWPRKVGEASISAGA